MSARPRPRPWRKIIIGAHLPNGASGPAHAGTLALLALGVAIRTWIGLGTALVGSGLNAPVSGSIRSNVVMSASRISSMFDDGIVSTTPNSANAALGVAANTGPGSAVCAGVVYGSAASWAA